MKLYTIIIFAENRPGVLYRIADLFLRRKLNIESLTVSETEKPGVSRFTILVKSDKLTIEKTVKQLYRIIEVFKVFEKSDEELVYKEVALFKVTSTGDNRKIEEIANVFKAAITHIGRGTVTIEKTGSEAEINALFGQLKPFGIEEFVRSGRIAVFKDATHKSVDLNTETKESADIVAGINIAKEVKKSKKNVVNDAY